jgi:cytochrome c biogenesis protein CcmG/thiol:disulfide interchange protein DsbE
VIRGRLALAAAIAALAAVVVAGVLVAQRDGTTAVPTPVPGGGGDAAPALSGTDPVTGKLVSLADFRGKPVVINIWASWCPGCIAEARDLAEFARRHPEAQVLGVDTQDSKSGARAFYARWGWTHPSIFDPSGSLAARLGLQGLPSTYFLDERHEIVARIVGETDLAGFEDGLRRATSES